MSVRVDVRTAIKLTGIGSQNFQSHLQLMLPWSTIRIRCQNLEDLYTYTEDLSSFSCFLVSNYCNNDVDNNMQLFIRSTVTFTTVKTVRITIKNQIRYVKNRITCLFARMKKPTKAPVWVCVGTVKYSFCFFFGLWTKPKWFYDGVNFFFIHLFFFFFESNILYRKSDPVFKLKNYFCR